ncbi:MAG: hypothetical protein WCB75_12810, partial [Pseudolabrys sp.]
MSHRLAVAIQARIPSQAETTTAEQYHASAHLHFRDSLHTIATIALAKADPIATSAGTVTGVLLPDGAVRA